MGGGVGCPFLKEVVEVEGRDMGCFWLFCVNFILAIDVSTVVGLFICAAGRDVPAAGTCVLGILSTGLRS